MGWAGWRLIRVSKGWGSTASERVHDLPGDELLPEGSIPTYAITIAAPPKQVWPCLVEIGRGRGGFYTYTAIERLLGADIVNVDRIDPTLQTLKPGDRIRMTPERRLRWLPGQFCSVREVLPGRALVLERKPPESPERAIWSLVLEPSGNRPGACPMIIPPAAAYFSTRAPALIRVLGCHDHLPPASSDLPLCDR
jgi:hypothetical protein